MDEAIRYIEKKYHEYDSIEKNDLGLHEIIETIKGIKYSFILIKDDENKKMVISIYNFISKEAKVYTIDF